MGLRVQPPVGGEEPPIGSDHVRDPGREAVDRHRPERRCDPSVRIRDKVEGEAVLVLKFLVGRLALNAHAEDDRSGFPKGVRVVAEGARLSCASERDRKSTRLNSSHVEISYAVFCLKKKKNY